MNKKSLYIGLGIAVVIIGVVFLSQNKQTSLTKSEYVSTDVAGLIKAKSTDTVELKNHDTYDLTASYVKKGINGKEYRMLAYNGSIPGPLIKIPQGAEITINFKNDTDMKSLLHSHGVRMENAFDGAQTSQKEMEPGEMFSYRLKFPDAGMYWYHPHVREDYEQELGLYGNYLVTPSDSSYWSPVNREVPLFLDDILIEDGRIALSKRGADRTLMGRFGNTMLVNGETNYSLHTKAGEVIRFYITNSANTRTFNFSIPGAKMKLVGADGGKYERETWSDGVILSPSERAIIEVLFAQAGSYKLEHKTPERMYTLGTIIVASEKVTASYAKEFTVLRSNKDIQSEIDQFRPLFNKPADKNLKLTIDMGMDMQGMMQQEATGGHNTHMMGNGQMMSNGLMMASGDPIEWEENNSAMNIMSNPNMMKWVIEDEETGKKNMDIDWNFKVGDKVKIKITNDPNSMHPMQHPIHFHGQRFLVLNTNGKPNDNLVWKDTTLIQNGDTVELLVDMTNPGEWMAHCHIAEHLEASMMMKFKVQ